MNTQLPLFAPRFLEHYAGSNLLNKPVYALVELIANSWDAGATRVDISWPTPSEKLLVSDNGIGMSEDEFEKRWMTLAYNRSDEQGEMSEIPPNTDVNSRRAFGKNGVGRFAGFCFSDIYDVQTCKDGKCVKYSVSKGTIRTPISLEKIESRVSILPHGTTISLTPSRNISIPVSSIMSEIAMRFLADPQFFIYVNNSRLTMRNIPDKHLTEDIIMVDSLGQFKILSINTNTTDRTTNQHGIAWQVNGRLVGECTWKGSGQENLLDGRRVEAKRLMFIVEADPLSKSVLPDWSGFRNNDDYNLVNDKVQESIRNSILEISKSKRREISQAVYNKNRDQVDILPPRLKLKWATFVKDAQESCPSITESDLTKLGTIIANLELSNSRYRLLSQLSKLNMNDLDKIVDILVQWDVDSAKEVLDELRMRISLIKQLKEKVYDTSTDEVQELQPLFKRGLWIFGPEYETIEFTSNEGMTKVIQKLYGSDVKGSQNRPDFAITANSTVGLYSYPKYDNQGGEIGPANLTIVELKKPGISLGDAEKGQCWKYVKELKGKGLVLNDTKVTCFVLGSRINPLEVDPTDHGAVRIIPMTYDTVINRADSRTHKLYEKVKSTPFLLDEDDTIANGVDQNLFANDEF